MKSSGTRKLTLVAGTPQNTRDLTKPRPTYSNYYYASGGGTVEVGNSPTMASGDGFPVAGGTPYTDRDQSHERYALVTGANVTFYIEDFYA